MKQFLMMVMLTAAAVMFSGCASTESCCCGGATLTQSFPERCRTYREIGDINCREMNDDVDSVLMADRPSYLTKYYIRYAH